MIPFIDLEAQKTQLGSRVEEAISRVIAHGKFIMGPEVAELEARLAKFCGVRHAVSCASGTDALFLALLAKNVGRGDAVFVPSMTFVSTAEVVVLAGATPVFVDVCKDTFNIDIESLKKAIAVAKAKGLTPKVIAPVDLFGLPADYNALHVVAQQHGMWILSDAAQSFGARYKGKRVGTLGEVTATSFFPAKPLGCYGDGGAVFTDDEGLARIMESLRVHGKGEDKYDNVRVGMNARLDTMQAAVLLVKLDIYEDEIIRREQAARRYQQLLKDVVQVPFIPEGCESVWAQFTILLPEHCNRDAIAKHMQKDGIPTAVYYPKPLHRQSAYTQFPAAEASLPVSEMLSERVLSLPMHPYLEEAVQVRIAESLSRALQQSQLRKAS